MLKNIQLKTGRIYFLDELRGVLIIYVVLYHLIYDISVYSTPISQWLFSGTVQAVRIVGTGLLIFISGISCVYSRNNLLRGIKTFGIGMCITLVTYFIIPDELVLFGILHFLGISMMLYGLCSKLFKCASPPIELGFIICFILFLFTFNIYSSELGFFGNVLFHLPEGFRLPSALFFLGISSNHVYSADYYPLLPWFFLFLSGSFMGHIIKNNTIPPFFYKKHNTVLAIIGQHTMIIYLVHQPLLYGLVSLCHRYL